MIDKTQPADVKLTRQMTKILKVVRERPGLTAWGVAELVGCRPYWAMRGLEALEEYRWIRKTTDRKYDYDVAWEAIDYPKDGG